MMGPGSRRSGPAAASALAAALGALAWASLESPLEAEVCNVKVVTDANPDYSDIGSMLHSITDNWQETKDKCWAIFYWNHIARRQTAPTILHGMELSDPIRQFNDYGYTMCSTISGNNCAIFAAMGLPVKFWDISLHTVMEVQYDGKYHMFDNSLSALYTTCDGKTLAGVAEIGAQGACEKSGGRTEPGHIAKYHCLYSTSSNGFLTGCDTQRSVADEYRCFNPNGLKYRYYFNSWDLGHRWILNLRPGEIYARVYQRLDVDSPNRVPQGKPARKGSDADPAFFAGPKDYEAANPRYHIRGNGVRTFIPPLTPDSLVASTEWASGVRAVSPEGAEPVAAGRPGEVVFKIEGANVITSTVIMAGFLRRTTGDQTAISVSTNNGLAWEEVWKAENTGDFVPALVNVTDKVNGAYEVLVKVHLLGKAAASDARLLGVAFRTFTQLNSKTQPRLKIGKNTVYVGAGEQTESIVYWPDLQGQAYKQYAIEEENIQTLDKHPGYTAVMRPAEPNKPASVTFKMDAPRDITKITYGGRLFLRSKGHIDFLHSFDGGKTWEKSYTWTDNTPPWDHIQYVTVSDVPAGVRSVRLKYVMESPYQEIGLFAVRMEANYKPADASPKPMEVTFTWKEVQEDYSTVTRSHTQLVEKLPARYEINVGGADHPVMESLRVNLQGAATEKRKAESGKRETKYGYSDGKEDPGAKKFVDRWVTVGRILSEGKPYTVTEKSLTNWGAGDPDGKKLTDGVVGSTYTGGSSYAAGAIYDAKQRPEITIDLGKAEKCGAFRIHGGGYPWWDAMRGEVKDKVEVLTSTDNKQFASQGFFNFNLRWKDIPANYMWTDEESFCAHNFERILAKPVEARYVKFKLTPARFMSVSEVQVLDFIRYEPFDLRIALPDGKDRSDLAAYPLKHVPSK
jgi:hypothetical protein